MSRFTQRRFNRYSRSGVFTRLEPAINDLNFDSSMRLTTLDQVQGCGFWYTRLDGVWYNDNPLDTDPGVVSIDRNGCLVVSGAPIVAGGVIGEFSSDPETNYTAQIIAPRILRSDLLLEYRILSSQGANNRLRIYGCDPRTGMAATTGCDLTLDTVPLTLVEATLGAVPGPFTSDNDGANNKLLISCQRVNAGQKNIVISWYDRALAAIQTVTMNQVVPGVGDLPIMWNIQVYQADPGTVVFSKIQTSSTALAYGDAPV